MEDFYIYIFCSNSHSVTIRTETKQNQISNVISVKNGFDDKKDKKHLRIDKTALRFELVKHI